VLLNRTRGRSSAKTTSDGENPPIRSGASWAMFGETNQLLAALELNLFIRAANKSPS
jgi:hypothetical protein